jgi:RNA polymerase sigma-70 factor (ECF subfamily)
MHNSDAAEDIVQEAFAKALRFANTFRGDAQPATWIERIATNTMINYFKSCKDDRLNVSLDEASELIGSDGMSAVEMHELLAEFGSIWDELDDETKAAMQCVVFDEMTYPEAAERIGIKRNTLASKINRARNKFIAAANLNAEAV